MAITESDWKRFRRLRETALDRFCQRVLEASQTLCADDTKAAHERYSELSQLIQERDRTMADTFDNPRRSQAMVQLAFMVEQDLITDEELAAFSEAFQASVNHLLSCRRGD